MNHNAVISGTFSDFKTVKTRSVVQLVIEIPIELGERAIQMFGLPKPGEEIPVAVARLLTEPKQENPSRRFADLDPAQQAGILCGEPEFHAFIAKKAPVGDSAAERVRRYLGLESRKDIAKFPDAKYKWDALVSEYRDYQRYGDVAEGRS